MPVDKGEPRKIEVNPGDHIDFYAMRVSQAALESDVVMDFNGVELVVPKGEYNSSDIVEMWKKLRTELSEKYKNSPEGKAAAEASIKDIAEKQRQIDELTNQLDTLDFSNTEKVLDWCAAFQSPSDRIDTKRDKEKILNKFAENGYLPNVNLGSEYKPENKDNSARYLIGQALDGIKQIGAIHQVFHKFYDEWKARFSKMV